VPGLCRVGPQGVGSRNLPAVAADLGVAPRIFTRIRGLTPARWRTLVIPRPPLPAEVPRPDCRRGSRPPVPCPPRWRSSRRPRSHVPPFLDALVAARCSTTPSRFPHAAALPNRRRVWLGVRCVRGTAYTASPGPEAGGRGLGVGEDPLRGEPSGCRWPAAEPAGTTHPPTRGVPSAGPCVLLLPACILPPEPCLPSPAARRPLRQGRRRGAALPPPPAVRVAAEGPTHPAWRFLDAGVGKIATGQRGG